MIAILIADDHPVVREGLKQIISNSSDIRVEGEATNGQGVIDLATTKKFDVIVLDLNMPGRDGFEVLRELKRTRPKLPVLVLSVHPEDQVGVRVLKAGASGFMNKESAPTELLNAIRKIWRGGKYVSPALADRLIDGVQYDSAVAPHDRLSNREYQVFCLIAQGRTIKEIAEELSLSPKTIRTFRDRILEKMIVKNDVEITHYAIQHNLVEPSVGGERRG